MGILESLLGTLFETFGVFLFPAGVFTVGVIFYLLLYWIASVSDAVELGEADESEEAEEA